MIVLTGGAGFIGSCILARLNEIGRRDVIVVDHLEDAVKKENIKSKKYESYFDKKDFIGLLTQGKFKAPVKLVIHMGACSSTILQDADYFEENNFEYSRTLAKWCLNHSAGLIYASSAATYGDGSLGYSDDEKMIPKLKPLNLYGGSKQKFDRWVLEENLGSRFVGLKFFNVFGPNEYHKGDMRSVIAKAYNDVVKKGRINLFKSYKKEYKDGEQKRDFIYIKDAVDAVMFFIEHPTIGGIYNLGSGVARTWNDLAAALFKAVKKPLRVEYVEMPEYMQPRYQYFTEAQMSKLRNVGFKKPFKSLEEAVADYVPYLQKHVYI